jgi:oxalate decarboxylase/phosphoglucose isomerase-like protein (cupin superfamily)
MSHETMPGLRYVDPDQVETQVFPWGTIKWLSEPHVTNAQNFSMGVVLLNPGKGHERHNHPGVEEILYVVSGEGEQMVNDEPPQAVRPGMCIHIPADVYHSTINTGWEPLKLIAVYSPHGPEALLRELPDCKTIPPGALPG